MVLVEDILVTARTPHALFLCLQNSQTVRYLFSTHFKRQIELADMKIKYPPHPTPQKSRTWTWRKSDQQEVELCA